MAQRFKNVYFADYPAQMSRKKHLTLALGERDAELYESIRPLTSEEVRRLIGHLTYSSLREAAEEDGLAVNTFAIRLLRQKGSAINEAVARYGYESALSGTISRFEPLQATYKGGISEPLHGWYPFLEGYSPQFVEQVLAAFAPEASHVLDPFSGTGTTPLTSARLGKHAYYCELNPVLQYVTESKIAALTMSQAHRLQVADMLMDLADHAADFVTGAEPDVRLECTYARAFGKSRFFDDVTHAQVLRVRTALDRLACTAPILARLATVAALSSLIPGSLLIRRGDIRYKTADELGRNQATFIEVMSQQLRRIAGDLACLDAIDLCPTLVCENARRLNRVPRLNVEAVITSPPYLNGTNYFRNTKIELWFMRCLRSGADLAAFRDGAVTAGINDVTTAKGNNAVEPFIRQVVDRLAASAYDTRIPRMVAAYFEDMASVIAGLSDHLVSDALVAIDIGDSQYGDVHVPTDELLAALLEARGFVRDRHITLRQRMSRSGSTLRQVLLVYRWPGASRSPIRESRDSLWPAWIFPWTAFKANLPHQTGDYAKRNWGHPLHSLCSYQGKMKPSLAAHLVGAFVPEGGTLLDPFAGVGTIPFEAALHGVKAWGFELSPAALHIASAKMAVPDAPECDQLMDSLDDFIGIAEPTEDEQLSARAIHFNGALAEYFHPETFREVLLARRYFRQQAPRTPSEALVLASLLHILHGNRPYALSRRSHPITPFAPTGPAEYRALMPRLREKVRRSVATDHPGAFVPGHILLQDATAWWPQEIDQLDAIVTSPPFFDSTRFYLANWMRLWFCGWEADDFRTRALSFLEERQKSSFQVYAAIFRQARERLKPGGVMALHLGKSRKCDMASVLAEVASRWFDVADVFSESVSHCESHGIRDKGTVEEHTYLILR